MISQNIEEKIKRKLLSIAITQAFNNQEPIMTKGHFYWIIGSYHIQKKEIKEVVKNLKSEKIIETSSSKVRIILPSELMKRVYHVKVQSFGRI